MQQELSNSISSIGAAYSAWGVLLHGSHAHNKNTSSSDVDLIFFANEISLELGYETHQGTTIDYRVLTLPIPMREFMVMRTRTTSVHVGRNNRPILRAFATGVILLDDEDKLLQLQRRALAIWKAGPERLTGEEARMTVLEIKRLHDNATRSADKAREGLVPHGLAMLKIDQMFCSILIRYCHLCARWTDTVPALITDLETSDATASRLLPTYYQASSIEARLRALDALVDHVLSLRPV